MCTPAADTTDCRPSLVIAHKDHAFRSLLSNAFSQRGWDVHLARSGPDLRQLARAVGATAVVLDAESGDESGWLTCHKLTRDLPHLRVVLVGSEFSAEERRFATFVGAAALVNRHASLCTLVEEVCPPLMPALS
jgi:DNA-binding response OmpR family regulator